MINSLTEIVKSWKDSKRLLLLMFLDSVEFSSAEVDQRVDASETKCMHSNVDSMEMLHEGRHVSSATLVVEI